VNRRSDRQRRSARALPSVALRSPRSRARHDCSASKPIVPSRPSWLPSSSPTAVVAVCWAVDLKLSTDAAVHRHAVPRTDVTVLDQRLPLRLAKRSPRGRELGRCRCSSWPSGNGSNSHCSRDSGTRCPRMARFESPVPVISLFGGREHPLSRRPIDAPASGLVFPKPPSIPGAERRPSATSASTRDACSPCDGRK